MATLNSILKLLIELHNDPVVDEQTYADAASYAREAGDLAMLSGIQPERVASMITPTAAIALVSRYIAALPVQPTESLTLTALAKALGRRRSDVAALFKSGKLPGFDTSTTSRANYRFNLADVQKALAVKPATRTKTAKPDRPFLV